MGLIARGIEWRDNPQVGLLVSSPIFAEASKHVNAFRLIAVGLGIWTLSTAGCGIAMGFWTLILCRMLVGVGEASFVALASPFIGISWYLIHHGTAGPKGALLSWGAAYFPVRELMLRRLSAMCKAQLSEPRHKSCAEGAEGIALLPLS